MATKIAHKDNRIRLFIGAGFAALASAFAFACAAEEGPAGSPIVVQKQIAGAVRVTDVMDVMRETGNPDANRATGYRFIDLGAWDDTDLAPFVGTTPELAESEMLREIGRTTSAHAQPNFAVVDIVDVMRETGRYDAGGVNVAFHIKDIPDPMREIGRYDEPLTTQLPASELLREIGQSN